MFEGFLHHHPLKPNLFQAPRTNVNPVAGCSGFVNHDEIAVFAHLSGLMVLCTSGYLWVTIEDDDEDYVLEYGQRVFIPTEGKVIVGGRGHYRI